MSLTDSQSKAVAARGNVIVVAGAGTGKTSTLVERCLDVVREGASLDRLLMVTFTDAAAAEMRHRLRIKLQELVSTTCDAGERDRFAGQLALVEMARICTIHSFCLRLVQTHFHELGIDPEVSVLDEHQCRVLANQTLEELMQDCCGGSQPMHHAVQALLAEYAQDSDLLVRELVLTLHNYSQSLPNAAMWIQAQEASWAAGSLKQWEGWLMGAFTDWHRFWLPLVQAQAGVKNIDHCLAAMSVNSGKVTRARVAEVAGAVAKAGAAKWPSGSAAKVRDPLKRFFVEASFLASAAARSGMERDWQAVQPHMQALLALAKEFDARFARAKRDLGGVDFPDLEQLTLHLLLDAGQPSAVAREIQGQLDYVFVDECQDINGAQDAILSAVSRAGAEANRFLVGDVKQSIYQFRLADPRIFRRYENDWSGGDVARRILLTKNFRSRSGILEFVNTLFGGLMRDSFGGVSYEPLQAAESSRMKELGHGQCVELHFICKDSNNSLPPTDGPEQEILELSAVEREARLVVHQLRSLKQSRHLVWDKVEGREREVQWRDMVVLLRSPRPRIEAYAKQFHQAGIPLAAARAGFLEAIEISDLVSLLKLLDNPLQDIPLLAVLRSPLVGLSLNDLATIRAASEAKPFWRALRDFACEPPTNAGGDLVPRNGQPKPDAMTQVPINAPLRARAACFLSQFGQWRELVRQVGPSICLEQVLIDTHYDSLLSANERGVEQMANVRRLLDYARQFDPYQRQGLYRFLRFLESLEDAEESLEPAPVPARDAVQLMSIHRSKGLEFPVVVLAGLGSRFNLQDLNSVVLLDQEYGLAPKAMTSLGVGRYPTLPFWLAERRQRAQQLGEELRLLYVAATRARDRLILSGTMSRQKQGRWQSPPAKAVSDHDLLSGRCPLDWLTAWLQTVTRESDWVDDNHGTSDNFTWELWDPQDERLKTPGTADGAVGSAGQALAADPTAVNSLVKRLTWRYAHESATREAAKSSVSALRSRAIELEDEEAVSRFSGLRRKTPRTTRQGPFTAAELGTLHHRFLQHVQIENAADVEQLAKQASDLVISALLTQPESEALDLLSIAAFWDSDVGRMIRAMSARVRRELPFTMRFDDAEVRSILGQEPEAFLAGEFVVVQGVVDLAVLLENEIWLLDFKTDDVQAHQIGARIEEYRPQLQLYAVALERIHDRPVRHRWLNFLAAGKTVELA